MSSYNYLNEKIILPISDTLLGNSIYKDLKFLMNSQWWSADELKEYQNEKLRALIKHSYENVPYYNELFHSLNLSPDDIQTSNDLYKLPILTKEIIRENIKNKKIIAQNIPTKKMILCSSSGSTGEPLQYFQTKASESFNKACAIRGWYWMGYRLGDRYIKLSQNPRPKLKRIQDKVNNCLYLPVKQLTDENFNIIVKAINNYKPVIIRSYPDPLFFLVQFIIKNNIKINSLKAIATTGNILSKEYREKIENVFNCKIYDSYSCEGGANVSECYTHECYHSSMEYAITEILNKNNNEAVNGESGRVITTDLHNYAVPFIRYDTQDYVTKSINKCSCGKQLLSIDKIEGRDSDILVTPNGKWLIVHHFTVYFEWVDSVDQFQVIQNKIDEINILLKVNEKYTKQIESEILDYWQSYIGDNVKVKIEVVNEIPLTNSGKRRFLIRDKDIKLNI